MKNRLCLIMASLLVFFFLIFLPAALAQTPTNGPRYAACDLCGYCPPNPPPSNWAQCAACIYPDVTDPASNKTLLVDPQDNTPPTPAPGKQFTMLGCLGSNSSGGFETPGAVGGVVQSVLNLIFKTVGGLAFITLLYGSFIVITSQGNTERLIYGKKVIYGAIVGVIFALASVFIVNTLASGILKIPGFGPSS